MNADRIADELRAIYRADPAHAPALIELYLKGQLSDMDTEKRYNTIKAVDALFTPHKASEGQDISGEGAVWADIVSLLLGSNVSARELDSPELLEKLASTLNTLFESINDIMGVINRTLTGTDHGLATIRMVIGKSIKGENEPLEDYLMKIKEVFLISHSAFQIAAIRKMGDILSEFDPKEIESERETGLKFGPLRKAEFYDIFKERFERCESWFNSGKFKEELLREFEKNCQALLEKKKL